MKKFILKNLAIGILLGASLQIVGMIPTRLSAEIKKVAVPEMSDEWLEAKLRTTYLLNRHLSLIDIDVDVMDQVALLTGTVESPVQKELAEEIAKSVSGIKGVKNQLLVEKSTKPVASKSAGAERSFGQKIDDLTITASVKSKLLADSNISGLSIDVDTLNNEVTLSGVVANDEQRQLAVKIAENTDGVEDVVNRLSVKG